MLFYPIYLRRNTVQHLTPSSVVIKSNTQFSHECASYVMGSLLLDQMFTSMKYTI
jgi:hypothetical protein